MWCYDNFWTCGEELWEVEECENSQVDPEGWLPEQNTCNGLFKTDVVK